MSSRLPTAANENDIVQRSAKCPRSSNDSADPPEVKKAKYQCKYQKSWEAEFSCIKQSSRGESYVMWKYCTAGPAPVGVWGGSDETPLSAEFRQYLWDT